jgi:hypothetical protein
MSNETNRPEGEVNPYESPKSPLRDENAGPTPRIRTVHVARLFVVGAVLGLVSFLVSIAMVPRSVPNPSVHDLTLAKILGFVFPPLIGLWSGWVRRSWLWAAAGVAVGLGIGLCYALLCGNEFLFVPITMAFPCFLGGVASLFLGMTRGSWFTNALARFGKGLVAGLVLGFVYTALLNLLGLFMLPFDSGRSTSDYIAMMWRAGPISMSVASGLYLMLFQWSSNFRQSK